MDSKFIVKINYLLLGFGLVLYFMYYLNNYGLGKNIKAALSVQSEKTKTYESSKAGR
ncbi:MAG: hypothetical protein HOO06_15680 [Bdellovibrionaceae bacterium]|nr:hypothetical protein [Pseudobdellovibrionaceae bacterium]